MRSVLSLGALLVVFVAVHAAEETYPNKYDNVNLDEILNNQRLYKKYFDCVRGIGKCTPDGLMLKERIPDALKTQCSKCSPKQKAGVEKVVRYMIKEKPDDFKILEDQFDPEGVYRKKYESQRKAVLEGKPFKF